jgi:hypothetical protein
MMHPGANPSSALKQPTREAPPSAAVEAMGFAEHALATDLEDLITLATLYPEMAAQSLANLADLADRFGDLVGGLKERFA